MATSLFACFEKTGEPESAGETEAILGKAETDFDQWLAGI